MRMKRYNLMYGIGKSRYVVNHTDESKSHPDGSTFYDIAIFSNRKDRDAFINKLESQGYQEE